jgi:hypothetical protein
MICDFRRGLLFIFSAAEKPKDKCARLKGGRYECVFESLPCHVLIEGKLHRDDCLYFHGLAA